MTTASVKWKCEPLRVGGAFLLPIRAKEGGKGTHHSWNLSTQTGSLPSPRGTWGRRCGGTSLRAVGTEIRRTCTWGGASREASGSRCCCGGSLSGTCGQEEREPQQLGREKHPAGPGWMLPAHFWYCPPPPTSGLRRAQSWAASLWMWGHRATLTKTSKRRLS